MSRFPCADHSYDPYTHAPQPDVCWGDHGIDALLWADPPPPYEAPRPKTADASPEPMQGGEA